MDTPVPREAEGRDGAEGGRLILLVLVVAISITVAIVYMVWTRVRAVSSAYWEASDRND